MFFHCFHGGSATEMFFHCCHGDSATEMFFHCCHGDSATEMFFHCCQAIVNGFLADFPAAVKDSAGGMVDAAIEIYGRMSTDLLPTPTKSHYVFNLRDLSKCVQGLLRADSGVIREQVCWMSLSRDVGKSSDT